MTNSPAARRRRRRARCGRIEQVDDRRDRGAEGSAAVANHVERGGVAGARQLGELLRVDAATRGHRRATGDVVEAPQLAAERARQVAELARPPARPEQRLPVGDQGSADRRSHHHDGGGHAGRRVVHLLEQRSTNVVDDLDMRVAEVDERGPGRPSDERRQHVAGDDAPAAVDESGNGDADARRRLARFGDERREPLDEVVGGERRSGVGAARPVAADEERLRAAEVDADRRVSHLSG